jgi:hypothetical protein
MKKKSIEENDAFDSYHLNGSLVDIIYWLNSQLKDGWENMDIDFQSQEIWFTRNRIETDEEFEKRKQILNKQKENKSRLRVEKEKEERLLYEKLKRKFDFEPKNIKKKLKK